MASDDRNDELDNLTVTDSLTDPGGTTHTGEISGGSSSTSLALENTDGTTLVSTDTLHADTGLAFSDDGDGTATIDVPTAGITPTELDTATDLTWEGTITIEGGAPLKLDGATQGNDKHYIEYYWDSANPNTRSAYIGNPESTNDNFVIKNDHGGNFHLNGGGDLGVDGTVVYSAANNQIGVNLVNSNSIDLTLDYGWDAEHTFGAGLTTEGDITDANSNTVYDHSEGHVPESQVDISTHAGTTDAHHAKTQPSDVDSSNWSDYELQKDGTDGQGIINFHTQ